MATCSICTNSEASVIVNQLLEKRATIDDIAQQTGFHRSSIHRHKAKCFAAWKAARLKARRGRNDEMPGRTIVCWPGAFPSVVPSETGARTFTYFGEIIRESELKPSDIVFQVTYRNFVDRCHDVALLENAPTKLAPA